MSGPRAEVEIVAASPSDKPVLRNLTELCQHDYSEFNRDEVDEHGLFGYRYLDHYWTEPGRHPFLVRASGKLAGFVLVRTLGESEGQAVHSIAEFFILRRYRRLGIGRAVAHRVFELFPGEWRVAQEAGNRPAQAFWRKVIAEYTGGDYEDQQRTEDPDGPVQTFRSPNRR